MSNFVSQNPHLKILDIDIIMADFFDFVES